MKNTWFVSGTDTGVGKTLVSCALLHAANKRGLKTLGLKPVAAGCEQYPEGLRNEDALALQQAASLQLPYEQVNPVALKAALSPHIAASYEGKRLSVDRLAGYCRGALFSKHDFALIEGAGGWRVPLSQKEYLSGLPKLLNLPVIVVIGMRLGCLNHAVLTLETIARDGLNIAAWVANVVDENMAALDENLETLKSIIPAPCLGLIPRLVEEEQSSLFDRAAVYLDIEPLIGAL